ncbi:unnamed protein product [Vitrella brassicaformis CCMP3155]|uniref:Uncharacterized protein n=1 Tax=Vitrella brassicaformis (strain CCMP3155) TaxID=1169540 RepID=A0A0G4ECD6_VITBC|nr:unnamed protein product [Vitrella brassicaformis CCMP3155]|mmetsp:Transcript_20455/g.49744  ORF Transcript_20455/g.49744 Transcript_20455/m.49744 type:complete len:214 (+) Transcript_20455:190-831(+)|eukprot:CEL93011.1 unnamed protein product [Vitrella brassicaformis CCMP3155]
MFARVLGLLFLVTLTVGASSPLRKLAPEGAYDGDSPDDELTTTEEPSTTTEEPPYVRTAGKPSILSVVTECDPTDLDCMPLAPGAVRFISPTIHVAQNDSSISEAGAARVICNDRDSACASVEAQFKARQVAIDNPLSPGEDIFVDRCNIAGNLFTCNKPAADEYCRQKVKNSITAISWSESTCSRTYHLIGGTICTSFLGCWCFGSIDCQTV